MKNIAFVFLLFISGIGFAQTPHFSIYRDDTFSNTFVLPGSATVPESATVVFSVRGNPANVPVLTVDNVANPYSVVVAVDRKSVYVTFQPTIQYVNLGSLIYDLRYFLPTRKGVLAAGNISFVNQPKGLRNGTVTTTVVPGPKGDKGDKGDGPGLSISEITTGLANTYIDKPTLAANTEGRALKLATFRSTSEFPENFTLSDEGKEGLFRKRAKVAGDIDDGTMLLVKGEFAYERVYIFVLPCYFGVKGDGVTNDSEAAQKMLDYLSSIGGGTAYFPKGTYLVNLVINSKICLQGDGTDATILKAPPGSNKDVIQGANFLTLTGTTVVYPNTFGVRSITIRNLKIDGNKANNTSGFGIRIWGCIFDFNNIVVQNCAQDGIWTEFTTHNDVTTYRLSDPSFDMIESRFHYIKSVNNNGNGWIFKGPHDSVIEHFYPVGNLKWGFRSSGYASIEATHWNSFQNEEGSFDFGASFRGSHIIASAANKGIGVNVSEFGSVIINDFLAGGHEKSIVLRGGSNSIQGEIMRSTVAAVEFREGVIANRLDLIGDQNPLFFKVVPGAFAGPCNIRALVNVPAGGALLEGNIADMGGFVQVRAYNASNEIINAIPGNSIRVAGYDPIFPQSFGVIATVPEIATQIAPLSSIVNNIPSGAGEPDYTVVPQGFRIYKNTTTGKTNLYYNDGTGVFKLTNN